MDFLQETMYGSGDKRNEGGFNEGNKANHEIVNEEAVTNTHQTLPATHYV